MKMNYKRGLRVGNNNIRATTDGKYISFDDFQKLCGWNLAHLYEDKELCKKIVGTKSDLFCRRIVSMADFRIAIPHHFKKEDGVLYISYSLVKHIASVEPDVVGKSVSDFLEELKVAVLLYKFSGWFLLLGVPIILLVIYLLGVAIHSILNIF